MEQHIGSLQCGDPNQTKKAHDLHNDGRGDAVDEEVVQLCPDGKELTRSLLSCNVGDDGATEALPVGYRNGLIYGKGVPAHGVCDRELGQAR